MAAAGAGRPAPADFKTVTGHRWEALFVTASATGLREGELLGLRWDDVDFDDETATVRGQLQRVDGKLDVVPTKSETSRRVVDLAYAAEALRAHRTRQLEQRLAAGSKWQERGFVFASRIGTPLIDRNLLREFKKLLTRAGLPTCLSTLCVTPIARTA